MGDSPESICSVCYGETDLELVRCPSGCRYQICTDCKGKWDKSCIYNCRLSRRIDLRMYNVPIDDLGDDLPDYHNIPAYLDFPVISAVAKLVLMLIRRIQRDDKFKDALLEIDTLRVYIISPLIIGLIFQSSNCAVKTIIYVLMRYVTIFFVKPSYYVLLTLHYIMVLLRLPFSIKTVIHMMCEVITFGIFSVKSFNGLCRVLTMASYFLSTS